MLAPLMHSCYPVSLSLQCLVYGADKGCAVESIAAEHKVSTGALRDALSAPQAEQQVHVTLAEIPAQRTIQECALNVNKLMAQPTRVTLHAVAVRGKEPSRPRAFLLKSRWTGNERGAPVPIVMA